MISSTMSSQAATRALGNRDILMDIVRHLDRASLYPFLLTSKACAIATLPRLYYTYTLSPNIPSTFVDYDPAPNTSRPDRWMRRIAWSYIRTLQIPTHSESTCTLIHQDSLPSLPNLQTIEMKGGGRTQKMGKECKPHECKILAQFTAQQMVIRKLHLLPSLHVNHMVVILRPCQFPFDPRGDPVVVAGTFGVWLVLKRWISSYGMRTIDSRLIGMNIIPSRGVRLRVCFWGNTKIPFEIQ